MCEAELVPELFDKLAELLERANYRRLSREEIEHAASAASDWGVRLRVDFDVLERLEMFARGDTIEQRELRKWRTLYRPRKVTVPLYQRLVLMVRMRDGEQPDGEIDARWIYLKIFKNIPKQDLDMLLPGTRFRMTLLDRGKVILPTVSGLILAAVKIVKGALLLAFAGVYGMCHQDSLRALASHFSHRRAGRARSRLGRLLLFQQPPRGPFPG